MGQLTVIEALDSDQAIEIFTKSEGLDAFKEQFKSDILSVVPDLSTQKGRDAVASNAFKANKQKSKFEATGKALSAEYKDIPKKIDATRKMLREFFEEIAVEARRPLTEWEAEEAIKAEAEKARIEAEAVAVKVESDHELALLMHNEWLAAKAKKEADELAERKRLQQEHDERIAKAAQEEEARKKQAAIDQAEKEKQDAINAQAKAEQDLIDVESRRKQEALDAENQRIADKQAADRSILKAAEDERKRIADEAEAVEQARLKREADTAHMGKINKDALDAIIASSGITEAQAKQIITAIVKGAVPSVTIHY